MSIIEFPNSCIHSSTNHVTHRLNHLPFWKKWSFTYLVFVDSHVIGLLSTWFLMKICMASSVLPPPLTSIVCRAVEMLVESIVRYNCKLLKQYIHERTDTKQNTHNQKSNWKHPNKPLKQMTIICTTTFTTFKIVM